MAAHEANTTSKLQTELGTYHLQYDEARLFCGATFWTKNATWEDNPVPKNMSTWPSTAELVKHFQEVAEEYGIMPCPTLELRQLSHTFPFGTESCEVREDVYKCTGNGD